MLLRVHRIIKNTQVSGPGIRFCLWVQGCSRQCNGCMLPETWPHDGGYLVDTHDLFHEIMNAENIEGVTFLGGEPFEQPEALFELGQMLKHEGLSILAFTGFTMQQLEQANNDNIKNLLSVIDLLIDSPFIIGELDLSRPWVGSSNQRYIFLTNRYCYDDIEGIKNKLEIRISPNGKAMVNGMGDFEKIKKFI